MLSVLPVILYGYLDSRDRLARQQVWLGLRDRSAAIAHAFAADQTLVESTRVGVRSARLAGFGPETAGAAARPPLPTPVPAPGAPAAPIPSVAILEPPSNDMVRGADGTAWAPASFLTAGYWDTTEIRLAAFAYVVLVVLAALAAISILRSVNRFREAAYEIALGRIGDNALIARNGVRELSGVAWLLDRMVFDLRYMSDQMRSTAEENAHTLRTPLATMRAALGAIRRSLPPDEPRAQRALKIIDISLDRLSDMVNSAQRNDTAMADLVAAPRVPIDLTELTYKLIGEIAEHAQSRNIRLRKKLQDGVMVHASAAALRAALSDVIASAANVSPRYGEIAITLEDDGAQARLVVADRGGDADAPQLFFQHDFSPSPGPVDPQSTDQTGATRLGLWHVKRTVEAFGGQISAQLNQRGGMSVCIVLPSDRR